MPPPVNYLSPAASPTVENFAALPSQLAHLRQALEALRQAVVPASAEWVPYFLAVEEAMEAIQITLAPLVSARETTRPLDPAQIEVLREEGLLESLTALFEEMVERTLREMRAAINGQDAKALADAAHLLKGSAVNFGAAAFAATCQEIEHQAMTAQPDVLKAHLQQLELDHGELMAALREEISAV